MKKFITILLSVILVLLLTACRDSGYVSSDTPTMSKSEAVETLKALLTKVDVYESEPVMDISGTTITSAADELPPIENYPLSVRGTAPIDVEIFCSTEKSGPDMDGWINEVAKKFNNEKLMTGGGGTVSVSIRPIASGLAMDYLTTGLYIPDAFSPANELWGDMLNASSVPIEKVIDRIAGNTAGILMSKSVHQEYTEKYGEVSLKGVVEAVMAGDLLLGYTNPYASSTGLNVLTAMLQEFDPANPLSGTAVSKLEAFQALVPPVAFTTKQMRESAAKGVLDAMIMEHQAYANEPLLKDYVFTPLGVRHDNPVYVLGDMSAEKREALNLFVDYCLNEDSQREAVRYGFNAHEEFKGEKLNMSGSELFAAQQVWKENKDGGRPIVAVFVADTSGSMEGSPIQELKRSLVNSSEYIKDDSYIGLVSYASSVIIELPIEQFNGQQKAYFNGAVKNLYASGGTKTYDAVLVAADLLMKKQEEIPNARLMMFVLSDGAQNEGYRFDKITPVISGLGIPVHTIGYNADLSELGLLSAINEASSINADDSNIVYNLRNIFNAQM